jgi:hypothetical protein
MASDSIRTSSRRRRYLVDRKRQLSATLRVVALVAVLLAMLVATIWYQNKTETEMVRVGHPELAEQMRAEDTKSLLVMIAISLIILGTAITFIGLIVLIRFAQTHPPIDA